MNPFVLFLLAIISPVLLAITLLVLPYAGLTAAAYIIYDKGQATHPLAGKYDDVFYMIETYTRLFNQWVKNIADVDILTYTLPLIGLPLAGTLIALWLTAKLARKLKDLFQTGVSI